MSSTTRLAGAVALALAVAACGGGGGGDGGGGGTSSETSTQSVSGSVTLSSLVSGSAAKSADASTAAAPATATITIRSYDLADKLTETRSVVAGSAGVFSSQVTLHNAGGYLVVDVQSPGTTGWSKRINYEEPADVDLNAVLRTAQTVVQNMSSGGAITASAEDGVFRFGVVRYGDGTRKAVAGGKAVTAAKAADGAAGMDLEIAIPSGALPDTDTLMANLVTFDPTDPEDALSFPGDYVDSDGNRLVSVAFDSIQVTDEAGNSVAELAAQAQATGAAVKSAANDVTVRRWIPSGSCASVGSFWGQAGPSGASNGNTIPIYTYNPNSGDWILLGDGTVQMYDGNTAQYADVSSFDATACTNGQYYLNILVSSEEYINAWWNLDYPLLASQPVEKCVDVTFTDNATPANPLAGLYAELSGTGLSRVSGSTRANGVVRLNSVVTDGDPTTATVGYWNPYDYSYSLPTTVPVADKSVACATHTIVVTKPKACYVSGTVTKSGSAVANEYVWAYSPSPYSYGWAYTNRNGAFEAKVACDVDMTLYVGDLTKTFRVDSVVAGDEASDDGSVAAMGSIAKPNTVPYAYGYLSSYDVKADLTTGVARAMVYVYGYDADGAADYPLDYTLSVGSLTPITGTIAQNDGYKSVALSGLTAGTYAVSLEVTDKQGAKGTASLGSLTVTSGNRSPYVSYVYTSTGGQVRLNRDGILPAIDLYAYAYDPDGDALTTDWAWRCEGACSTADGIITPSTAYSATFSGAAAAGDTLVFTYSANDGVSPAVTRSAEVVVLAARNQTPYFTSTTQSATEVYTAPATVTFSVEATDGDGDPLSYVWKVGGVVEPDATGTSFSYTIPATATVGQAFTVSVEVSDGYVTTPPKRTFTVTYLPDTADTEVILR